MVENYLLNHPWTLACIWAIVYSSDYYLTIWNAKLYRAQGIIVHENSHDMSPEYKNLSDAIRLLCPRWLVGTIGGAVTLLIPLWITVIPTWAYALLVGMLIVPELVIHVRHAKNAVTHGRLAILKNAACGRVEYKQWFSFEISAAEWLAYAVLLLLFATLTQSLVLLGGAVRLGILTIEHWRYSRKLLAATK